MLLAIILMILSALSEVISIASVFPILLALSSPGYLENNEKVLQIMQLLGIQNTNNFMVFIIIIFILIVTLSSIIRLSNLWFCTRLSAAIGSDFSCEAYEKTLYQPYSTHIQRNTAEIVAICTTESGQTQSILDTLLKLSTSLFTATLIFSSLIILNWKLAIGTISILILIYCLISYQVKKELKINGRKISRFAPTQIKSINEGLGSIREVLLNNFQATYVELYKNSDFPLRQLQAKNRFLADYPKFLIESISLIILILISFQIKNNFENFSLILPTLGIIVFSLQKLLPATQNIYASWAVIQAKSPSLEKIINTLSQRIEYDFVNKIKSKIAFQKYIYLENISFKYNSNKKILENINLKINKGEIIGIKGVTGSGKTTLINLIMGLLKPTNGRFYIDDLNLYNKSSKSLVYSWMKKIALVPQDIYLTDSTFIENIAFGIPSGKIDLELVKKCAKNALIDSFIEQSIDGYNTRIGEKGIKISGGQRQRIAIARALYKKAEVIILDEATSALDINTERLVMKSINSIDKNITLIMIAHRLSTLEKCDKIITLQNGKII